MGAIRIANFGGIVPRTSERLIGDTSATVALNVNLTDGELRPLRQPARRYTSAKSAPLETIYRIVSGGDYAWLTWDYDVDVAKSPLEGDPKWCYTGDGEPRHCSFAQAVSGGGNDYPATAYVLGIPKPVAKPSVSSSGGSGVATTRVYCITFISQNSEESGSSPSSDAVTGKVDDTWTISGFDAVPANSGTGTATGQVFTSAAAHWLRVGDQVVISSILRNVTAISDLTFTVDGAAITGATVWARKVNWNTFGMKQRLYRSAGTNATYQLVAERTASTSNWTDNLTDSQIMGDELISESWQPAPASLRGLTALPSGSLAGFVGNTLWFSEPRQPHAWLPNETLQAYHNIIAIEQFGSGIAVATEAKPYVVTGVEPGQMSMEAWEEPLPCLSKRSMVGIGNACLYSSPVGLISIGATGVNNWTLPYFTEREWNEISPDTMISALAERKLHVRYEFGDGSRMLIFNLQGDTPHLTEAHVNAVDIHADSLTGRLFFSYSNDVYEFNPLSGYPMEQVWQSKEFSLPRPQNLGAAKISYEPAISEAERAAILAEIAAVESANAPMLATGRALGGWAQYGFAAEQMYAGSALQRAPSNPPVNEVSFELWSNGTLRVARVVTSNKPFHLPSGYKTDNVMVKVVSRSPIKAIELADTKQALAQA